MNPPAHPAIVLAAGSSTRMGHDKAALPWLEGQTLLAWTVDLLVAAGWSPVVVLGPHNFPIFRFRLNPSATPVLNPAAHLGKHTSLAAGARVISPAFPRLLVASVDQPRPAEVYAALRAAADARKEMVVTPDRNGHRGHPVVLAGKLRERLLALGDGGLRALLDEFPDSTHRVSIASPECQSWDCNTPEAYREAYAWFRANRRKSTQPPR